MALSITYKRFAIIAKLILMGIILLHNCVADETEVQINQEIESLTDQNCSNQSKNRKNTTIYHNLEKNNILNCPYFQIYFSFFI